MNNGNLTSHEIMDEIVSLSQQYQDAIKNDEEFRVLKNIQIRITYLAEQLKAIQSFSMEISKGGRLNKIS